MDPPPGVEAIAEDQPARVRLLRYVLRPPLAKERLTLLPDNRVRLELKRPFRDGMTCSQCLLWM